MTASVLGVTPVDSSGGTSNTTVAVTRTVTAGNALVLLVTYDDTNGETITGVSDTLNGAWGAVLESQNNAGADQRTSMYGFGNTAGGSCTITATFSLSVPFRAIAVVEVQGVATSPFDGHNSTSTSSAGTGTDAITSGNASSSNQPALVLGFCNADSGSVGLASTGTGFSSEATIWDTATPQARIESKRVTATGNQAATFTAPGGHGSDNYLTFVVVLDEPAPVGASVAWLKA